MSRAARSNPCNTTEQPQERLPAINYSILKEPALRKKLRDLGIPEWGPRPLLQRRHTEWVNLWNANCDSEHPKRKRELLKELDIWERTQGGNASLFSSGTGTTVMNKDFDKGAWSASNGHDYKRLIANARRGNDQLVRPTIPESEAHDAAASNEPEETPNPGQSSEIPIVMGDVQKPRELPIDAPCVIGVENEAQQPHLVTDNQTLDAPSG